MMGLLFGAALLVELWEQTVADWTRGWRGRMRRQMRVRMQIAAAEQAPIRVSVPTAPSRYAVALADANRLQLYVPDVFGLGDTGGLN